MTASRWIMFPSIWALIADVGVLLGFGWVVNLPVKQFAKVRMENFRVPDIVDLRIAGML